jgi:hypothetical protein
VSAVQWKKWTAVAGNRVRLIRRELSLASAMKAMSAGCLLIILLILAKKNTTVAALHGHETGLSTAFSILFGGGSLLNLYESTPDGPLRRPGPQGFPRHHLCFTTGSFNSADNENRLDISSLKG